MSASRLSKFVEFADGGALLAGQLGQRRHVGGRLPGQVGLPAAWGLGGGQFGARVDQRLLRLTPSSIRFRPAGMAASSSAALAAAARMFGVGQRQRGFQPQRLHGLRHQRLDFAMGALQVGAQCVIGDLQASDLPMTADPERPPPLQSGQQRHAKTRTGSIESRSALLPVACDQAWPLSALLKSSRAHAEQVQSNCR